MEQEETIAVVIESDKADAAGLDPLWLARMLAFALHREDAPQSALSLLVTDDAGIQHLHLTTRRRHADGCPVIRGGERCGVPDGAGQGQFDLGDVAVSWDTAAVQGPEAGLSTVHEVAFLALHGLLHLLGADDATDDDRAAMHTRQHALLKAFLAAEQRA